MSYPKSFINTIMQYTKPNPDLSSLKWGQIHDDAWREYIKYMELKSHIDFKVQLSGLVINPSYPYIGANPDGVFTCSCCGEELLEIKCPFKYWDVSPISDDTLQEKNYFLAESYCW